MASRPGIAALLIVAGCAYDLDTIYDSVQTGDAGAESGVVAPQPLIELWSSETADADCRACAAQRCAEADSACRADSACEALTRCVAAQPSPVGQAQCRAMNTPWVLGGASVRERELGGPYALCVANVCREECEISSDLACLNKYAWPMSLTEVPLHLFLTKADSPGTPLANVRVRVCEAATSCEGERPEGLTDVRGLVELRLPTSYARAFTGYLEIQGEGLYPTLLKLSWNLSVETTLAVNVVNQMLFRLGLTQAGGIVPDPERGMLQLRMYGCQGFGQRGIRFEAEPSDLKSKQWYLVDDIPSLTARETGTIGSGGIIDVPIGNATVRALRASDGQLVAQTLAPVRAGFMTVVHFVPSGS